MENTCSIGADDPGMIGTSIATDVRSGYIVSLSVMNEKTYLEEDARLFLASWRLLSSRLWNLRCLTYKVVSWCGERL